MSFMNGNYIHNGIYNVMDTNRNIQRLEMVADDCGGDGAQLMHTQELYIINTGYVGVPSPPLRSCMNTTSIYEAKYVRSRSMKSCMNMMV